MGPSGSGKSTCCTAWPASRPDRGEVSYDGQRLNTLSDDRRSALRRDRFGFVFQSGQLSRADRRGERRPALLLSEPAAARR